MSGACLPLILAREFVSIETTEAFASPTWNWPIRLANLLRERPAGRRRLLRHRGALLRHLVRLVDRDIDFVDPGRLRLGAVGDPADHAVAETSAALSAMLRMMAATDCRSVCIVVRFQTAQRTTVARSKPPRRTPSASAGVMGERRRWRFG